jgi:hypothetical protein
VGVDEVGDAVGNDAGFARAGTSEDEERAFDVSGGFALGGIEAFEKVHWIEGFRRRLGCHRQNCILA